MKRMFPFCIKSKKQPGLILYNTTPRKSFWRLATVLVILTCLFTLSACGAMNSAMSSRVFETQNELNREALGMSQYGSSFLRNQNIWPLVFAYIIYGGTPPWAQGGGGKPQPDETTQSCKPIGSSCSNNDECCSRNCNNNTNRCQ